VAEPTPFATPEELRAWLEAHHETETELWVKLAKKGSGIPSITWPELVDEVLCFGWIDGHMKPIDDVWRRQRITPRRKGSKWSKRNIDRVRVLTEERRMRPAGLAAFAQRQEAGYTFEQERPAELSADQRARFEAEPDAWAWFGRQTPSYRKTCAAWVAGAKQEATRERRLQQLIEASARGEPPSIYRWAKVKP
jgi:uncharacterized protein YdeI (YjbR/CyaY-like superfamily)